MKKLTEPKPYSCETTLQYIPQCVNGKMKNTPIFLSLKITIKNCYKEQIKDIQTYLACYRENCRGR